MVTVESKFVLLPSELRSSYWRPGPRMFLERKVDASVNWHQWYRRDLDFLRELWRFVLKFNSITGGDSSNKGCFGRKTNLFRESGRFCWESGNLGNFSGKMRYFRDIEQRFDITCYQTTYIQWYAPSVCAVFYVFWHLKTAELPMIWKDQSATFPSKIAWSSSAIDHVQSPADWHKNRTSARHILSVHTSSHHSLVQADFYAAC